MIMIVEATYINHRYICGKNELRKSLLFYCIGLAIIAAVIQLTAKIYIEFNGSPIYSYKKCIIGSHSVSVVDKAGPRVVADSN